MATTDPLSDDPRTPLDPGPQLMADPPPPYPAHRDAHDRRSGRRPRRHRSTGGAHSQLPSAESDYEYLCGQPFPREEGETTSETTPLLPTPSSPRSSYRRHNSTLTVPTTRPRTISVSSTAFSTTSGAPSLTQTVFSIFQQDPESDVEDYEDLIASPSVEVEGDGAHNRALRERSWKSYWRPCRRRAYWAALFHLLVLNFPFALLAWVYLFVFTLTGTTLLMALPLGAVLCFFNLLGARTLARGELAIQTRFHGPLAYPPPYPPHPIFTRIRQPTPAEVESGTMTGPVFDRSFYRNAYAMFTDSTSYRALFYFLVIKPAITILMTLALFIVVPLSFVLVLPAPALLRAVRRLGIWQANIAVEGLYMTVS
ncbi:hypothetical protein JAAARDRAFT_43079 [Jaapia argillacea MUCL 33604]|uniref:Uncharacterized protein n=1 Tax=Jaapia argillacea MUCL 33604 TaxID=933084 RepID=A0A067P316_9AGAM|nr:hypothetical protein JAAARDRAFT_43079 [Jaapia argillacea MUCL 33604]